MNEKLTVIIMSCDAFSDLWDGQVQQMERYWPSHPEKIYLVTDKETNKTYETVEIAAMGEDLEWSERLSAVLDRVETPYVFFTLDDYYLIEKVKEKKIDQYVELMQAEQYDYIRLFRRRKKKTLDKHPLYPELRGLDPNTNYAINLYMGLWRTDFMRFAANDKRNAWQFEVSLRRKGTAYGAKCLVCMDKAIYPFLDVVRKGKLLRKAARYFKKHGIYNGKRAVNTWYYEFKLAIRTLVVQYAPERVAELARKMMRAAGYHFFSDEA